MDTIQWRPDPNVLTVPASCKITYVSSGSAGTDDLAAAMTEENPNYTEDEARMMLAILEKVIRKSLLKGKQTTIDGLVTFGLSFTGRLDSPEVRCRRLRRRSMSTCMCCLRSSRSSGSRPALRSCP